MARYKDQAFRPRNEAEAGKALGDLKPATYTVSKREDKPTRTRPPAPFITSTLHHRLP